MRELMINGDDYGMNERCTLAVARAFSEGLITDTTMMANGAFFDRAVEIAEREGFSDRIGIHLNLTQGFPLTGKIKSMAAFVSDGRFHRGFWNAPRALTAEEREAVREELLAQIDRLTAAGITVTHADSHHYIHTYSCMAQTVASVLKASGIRRVRINRTFDTKERPVITEHRIDNAWWREQGFCTLDHFGRLSDAASAPLSDSAEIMVHPDFDRSGALIDRERTKDGFPEGTSLYLLRKWLRG